MGYLKQFTTTYYLIHLSHEGRGASYYMSKVVAPYFTPRKPTNIMSHLFTPPKGEISVDHDEVREKLGALAQAGILSYSEVAEAEELFFQATYIFKNFAHAKACLREKTKEDLEKMQNDYKNVVALSLDTVHEILIEEK